MKVSIQLQSDHGPASLSGDRLNICTSNQSLRGEILLHLQRADAVSKITLTLQGKLVSSVQSVSNVGPLPLLDGNFHAVDSHKILKIKQVIFPQHNVPIPSKGFSLSKGETSIPFTVHFPILSECAPLPNEWIKHVTTTLPPTFSFNAPGNEGAASVEYSLKVEVTRPGRFKSDVVERRILPFLPLDPSLPPPMVEPTTSKSVKNLKYEVLKSPGATVSGNQVLDRRQVTLETTLPAPAILRLGGVLQLGASITAADGSHTTPALYLRSFIVNLMTEVTLDIGPNLKSWQTCREIYSDINLELEIGDEKQDIMPINFVDEARMPQDVVPSFTTCTIKQEHFVVVVVGLSFGRQGHIMNMKTSINVEIHSGMNSHPDRNALLTPEEERNEEEVAFIPWRIGSDRHLGILGRRDSRNDNAPPPPYV